MNVTEYHTSKMPEVTRSLFPNSAPDFFVEPPFYCDYGDGIYAAEGVFINFGAVILDGANSYYWPETLIAREYIFQRRNIRLMLTKGCLLELSAGNHW